MVDSDSPHAAAAALLAALDARRWSDVAAHCAEQPLAELRDSIARLIKSLRENARRLPDTFDVAEALREYGTTSRTRRRCRRLRRALSSPAACREQMRLCQVQGRAQSRRSHSRATRRWCDTGD